MLSHCFANRYFRSGLGMLLAAIVIGGLLNSVSAASLVNSRPNIVLVITDDQGYGEVASHGNDIIQTPHLDRLRDQSLRFVDFHVSPTCAPTRSSLMTGRHEFKNGVTHTIMERERMTLSAVTIAETLQKAGYTTGIFGKWHLGDEDEYQPNKRGFDEVLIHGGGGINQTFQGSCGDVPNNSYFDPILRHNGTFVQTKGYCCDVYFDYATKWIDKQRQTPKPFFAYIASNTPHAPYHSPQDKLQLYENRKELTENEKPFYGMISNVDDNVGTLRAQLEAWKLAENTLFIFMTDNGSALGQYYNAGMKGRKGTPYQGGTRVPFFVCWPNHIQPGEAKQLAAHIDVFPTIAELIGQPLPTNLDGRSLLPVFQNRDAVWEDRFLVTHVGRWKTGEVEQSKFVQCAVRTARFRFVKNTELYDILTDPSETTNVIDKYPEEVTRIRAEYDKWWDSILPCLVNENVTGPDENPFKASYRAQMVSQQ